MHLKVHLRKTKKALSNAVKVAKFERIDAHGDYVELQVVRNRLRISSFGGGIDTYSVMLDLDEQVANTDVVRLTLENAMEISKAKVKSGKKNQDEQIELELTPEGRTLRYITQSISGSVQVDQRATLMPVFARQGSEDGDGHKKRAVVTFTNVGRFKRALALALEVQRGWAAADRPREADFIWFQVCATTDAVDPLISYASGNVVAVYSSDHQRMFATYIPATGKVEGVPNKLPGGEYAQIDNTSAMNRVFSVEARIASVLVAVLPDEGVMKLVAKVDSKKRVIEWRLYNTGIVIKFRDALAQPEADFERFAASIVPDVVVEHTPTRDLGSTLTAISKCQPKVESSLRSVDYGMTLSYAEGGTLFSSAEGKRPHKHIRVETLTAIPEEAATYVVVDGAGVASMVTLSAKNGGEHPLEFYMNREVVVINDYNNHARVVLLKYSASED